MVASRQALLATLAARGPQAADVTDVVFSHHHPDHTVNAALFPAARIHDHWAVYLGTAGSTGMPTAPDSVRPSGCCGHPAIPPRTSPRWRPRPVTSSRARTRGGPRTGPPTTRSAPTWPRCTPAGSSCCPLPR
ncbi:MAG: MBL fold metallo-hydrolase [Actinobacteria bacterium]|nr:MBL fold metallo-hydrolase [Actinomycetota bacterium]